jgi:hypothetical protein
MKAMTKLVLALGLAAGVAAVHAESHDTTCRVTTYFTDSTMKTQVGIASTCPGFPRHSGRVTQFVYTEEVDQQQDPLADPGSLPCEWPLECTNEATTPVTRPAATEDKSH